MRGGWLASTGACLGASCLPFRPKSRGVVWPGKLAGFSPGLGAPAAAAAGSDPAGCCMRGVQLPLRPPLGVLRVAAWDSTLCVNAIRRDFGLSAASTPLGMLCWWQLAALACRSSCGTTGPLDPVKSEECCNQQLRAGKHCRNYSVLKQC